MLVDKDEVIYKLGWGKYKIGVFNVLIVVKCWYIGIDLKDDKICLLFIVFFLYIFLFLYVNGIEICFFLFILNVEKNKVFRKCFFIYIMGLKFIILRIKYMLYLWVFEKILCR